MRPGLALASVALGAVGVVFAGSTWITWFIVQPGGALPTPLSMVVGLVLGALWVLVLGAAVLSVLFGVLARTTGRLALTGIALGVVAGLLALGGALAFVVAAMDWTTVHAVNRGL
ncbi:MULTISPECIES: hypothetical protein [Amycolatopsis]|uniref:Major facilitator superfamily (MFS) profile domain-containing protein n=2 Tax=Amycolatopsis TaxID=1813 RepID=A0A1I3XL44_9PSEU|nr:hypothetical protein [Amycolatopsis sacchari]SFK20347.1 hypothetical protein SAMN05421835_115180 [Amycolatopsis sacchari]